MTRSFHDYVASDPDRIALVAADGATHSYAGVARRAAVVSRILERSGYSEGDVVCALLPNGVDILFVQRGVMQMPVYFSTINWHLTPSEIAHILSDSAVQLFFTNRELEAKAREALEIAGIPSDCLVVVDGDPSDPRSLAALSVGLPEGRPEGTFAGTRRLYTSGTTGRPKAVLRPLPKLLPQQTAAANVSRAALYGVDHEQGTYLSVAPLYHAAPLSYADQSLDLGHTVVIVPKWNTTAALDAIRHHRVTWTYMVPLMFQELLALPADERAGVDTLRAIVHTAAPCPPHVKRAMIEWVGPILTEIYGGTEGSATSILSGDWLTHPGSVGRARPGVTLDIRNDDGEVLAPREIGHIYFENPALAFVYDHDSEKTASSRIGGAITLGDIGYLDEDGYLFLCDRLADTIISGGVNIYPAETENALKEVTWVSDACVIGIPDERWGESVHAVVVLRENAPVGDSTSETLSDELRKRIASFKVPRTYEFVDTLPYSEAGKLLRKQVRDGHAAALPTAAG